VLQLGLLQLAMQQAVEHGFTPMIPPVLVKPESMEGTGFLGEHSSEVYHLEVDDLYLVGTSEVPLAAYHSGEILSLDAPRRYVGWSSCFRREAGSYGKDVRGIIRVHQFDKVEMFSYCRPEDAAEEHQRLLGFEEEMLAKVRVLPGDRHGGGRPRVERRPQVRLRGVGAVAGQVPGADQRPTAPRTRPAGLAPGTGTRPAAPRWRDPERTLATTRWIVAIVENHQLPDGSVRVPKALQPYLGGQDMLKRP
jgi:seryl-tRNA synthetase